MSGTVSSVPFVRQWIYSLVVSGTAEPSVQTILAIRAYIFDSVLSADPNVDRNSTLVSHSLLFYYSDRMQ